MNISENPFGLNSSEYLLDVDYLNSTEYQKELEKHLNELDLHDLSQLIRLSVDELCDRLRNEYGFGRDIDVYGTVDTLWPKITLIYKQKDTSCEFEDAKTFRI